MVNRKRNYKKMARRLQGEREANERCQKIFKENGIWCRISTHAPDVLERLLKTMDMYPEFKSAIVTEMGKMPTEPLPMVPAVPPPDQAPPGTPGTVAPTHPRFHHGPKTVERLRAHANDRTPAAPAAPPVPVQPTAPVPAPIQPIAAVPQQPEPPRALDVTIPDPDELDGPGSGVGNDEDWHICLEGPPASPMPPSTVIDNTAPLPPPDYDPILVQREMERRYAEREAPAFDPATGRYDIKGSGSGAAPVDRPDRGPGASTGTGPSLAQKAVSGRANPYGDDALPPIDLDGTGAPVAAPAVAPAVTPAVHQGRTPIVVRQEGESDTVVSSGLAARIGGIPRRGP